MVVLKLECEKCGHIWQPEQWSTVYIDPDKKPTVGAYEEQCPKCAQITYGPLTEEMVAQALWITTNPGLAPDDVATENWGERNHRQARFVLRLLNDLNEHWYIEKMPDDHKRALLPRFDWGGHLLDLAKQP